MDSDLMITLIILYDGQLFGKLYIEVPVCLMHCIVPAHSTTVAPSQICTHAARINVTFPWSERALRHSETIEDCQSTAGRQSGPPPHRIMLVFSPPIQLNHVSHLVLTFPGYIAERLLKSLHLQIENRHHSVPHLFICSFFHLTVCFAKSAYGCCEGVVGRFLGAH